MGKFEYTDNELEMLKVLKMQEADLNKLSAQTDTTEDSIKALKKDIQEEAARRGVDISSAINQQRNIEGVKVSAKDIPSWDELVRRADEEIDYQPIIEDFLTQNEIDFTLQEIQSIIQSARLGMSYQMFTSSSSASRRRLPRMKF